MIVRSGTQKAIVVRTAVHRLRQHQIPFKDVHVQLKSMS